MSGENPLKDKRELFCKEYLVDLNGAQAAIRAGYSKKTARTIANQLLTKLDVQERVQFLMNKRSERVEITSDYVLSTIQDTVERCRQATPVMEFSKEEGQMIPTGEWKFEHSGVLKGCELLGKHLKLFTDKVHHSGDINIVQIDKDDAEL